ncbi:MAG: PEP-CTERM sorting domain-containing protein [Massilia sp.]
MKNFSIAVLLSVCAQLAWATPVNLVQNGDFEVAVAGPGTVPGWSYSGGDNYFGVDADYIGSPNARPGQVFYDGASANAGLLAQSIATTAGALYVLEFDLQRYSTSTNTASNMASVDFGGTNVFLQMNTVGDWTHFIIGGLIGGPGSTTMLQFSNLNAFDFNQLDNVSLIASDDPHTVPEPATPLMLAAAAAALALTRRRRQH